MKRILFFAATGLMCFGISCKDSGTSSTTNTSDSSGSQNTKNLENNRKVMKAIETGDSVTINSLIADDAVDHQGPNGKDVTGGDNVRHMLADIHNHVKDLKFDVMADAANGDYIFSMSRLSGTTSDASMGMPAGTKMNMLGSDVIKVKDGKMVEHWGFIDANEMMKNMPKGGGNMNGGNGGKMNDKMGSKDSTHKM